MFSNRPFGLPPEGDAHEKTWDEVVQTADVGKLADGLQSVDGPEVQHRDFHKAPPIAAACPGVAGDQRQYASVGR